MPARQHSLPLVIVVWLACGALAYGAGALSFTMARQGWQLHQVASGNAGVPGTVTFTDYGYFSDVGSHPDEDCVGRFVPDAGGPARARVIVDGFGRSSCKPGKVVRVHLLKGDGGGGVGLDTNDNDQAFVPGHSSGSWAGPAIISALFALITLILAFPWLRLTISAVRAPFRRRHRAPQV